MQKTRNRVIAAISIGLLAGNAVGASAQTDETQVAAPVEFTSKASYSYQPARGVDEQHPDGSSTLVGEAWQFRFTETSDPRFDGTITITLTSHTLPGQEITVHAEAYRIESEGGAWQETAVFHLLLPWRPADGFGIGDVSQHVYVGEDGYEGWTVVAEHTWVGEGFDVRGYILEGDLPVAPEPWIAE